MVAIHKSCSDSAVISVASQIAAIWGYVRSRTKDMPTDDEDEEQQAPGGTWDHADFAEIEKFIWG